MGAQCPGKVIRGEPWEPGGRVTKLLEVTIREAPPKLNSKQFGENLEEPLGGSWSHHLHPQMAGSRTQTLLCGLQRNGDRLEHGSLGTFNYSPQQTHPTTSQGCLGCFELFWTLIIQIEYLGQKNTKARFTSFISKAQKRPMVYDQTPKSNRLWLIDVS